MAKQKGPTAEDRAEAIRVALSGIAHDLELGELAQRLAPLHPKNNTDSIADPVGQSRGTAVLDRPRS